VSSVVFEGGLGAMITTTIPGRDPSFAFGRAAFQEWCARQEQELPRSGGRRYEALEADGAPIIADDAAVTIAAGHAARVVLDVLDEVTSGGPSAWLLIGFRKGWVFDFHGHVIRLTVGEPPLAASARVEDDDALALAIELTQEAVRAAKDRE
jgi:hypothetical protein